MLERVVGLLAEEFRQSGKTRLFEGLKVYLVADKWMPPYAETARKLGVSEVAVHRLRERFRRTLRAEVGQTLDDPGDTDDEIHQLFEALKV